ncbi:hypothetical protein AC1031_002144 [Aphanomyces cochlioides]|nr:hypothetical protein AC1031_002144 [Aphanomyces cochlioides]
MLVLCYLRKCDACLIGQISEKRRTLGHGDGNNKDYAALWESVVDLLHKPTCQMTEIVDSLSSESSDVASPSRVDAAKPKRFRIHTKKFEVQQLQAEIRELEAQLREARTAKSKRITSKWQRAAMHQCLEKNKSLHKNLHLQVAIQERSEYIERLQKLILKTPRWAG